MSHCLVLLLVIYINLFLKTSCFNWLVVCVYVAAEDRFDQAKPYS